MSALAEVFARTKAADRAALMAYLPAGYPSVEGSLAAMRTAVENGADIVEIGLPYSDPLLDGPVIQTAVAAALERGSRVADVFRAVRAAHEAGAAAVVMASWNPVLQYGVERFAADLAAAGGSGLILPDTVPEEAPEWFEAAAKHDLDPIFLIAPSSTPERLASTTAVCQGFVYAASVMGVTGVREQLSDHAETLVTRAREVTDLPICVGIGVSNPEQAHQVAGFADGVIVGTALVRCLVEAEDDTAGLRAMGQLTRQLADGVRR